MGSIYNRFFSVDMLSKAITAMVTISPLLIVKDHIIQYCKMFIPSHIDRIIYFGNKNGHTRTVYIGWRNMFSMKSLTDELLHLSKDGYFMFVIWNNNNGRYEHVFLQY